MRLHPRVYTLPGFAFCPVCGSLLETDPNGWLVLHCDPRTDTPCPGRRPELTHRRPVQP